jgi:hypothetical protein
MAINDIVSICSSVVTLLGKYADTLSSDLVIPGKLDIVLGRPDHGISAFKLPAIMVAMDNYSEELNSLGTGAHRDNRFNIILCPITVKGIGSLSGTGQSEAEKEANKLTHNLVDLIRSKPDLSGTVSYVEGIDIDFNQEFGNESTYVKCNRISIRCFKFIS